MRTEEEAYRAQRMAQAGSAWDESKHPRDDHGRFASGGGSDDAPDAILGSGNARTWLGDENFDHPNLYALQDAERRGVWRMDAGAIPDKIDKFNGTTTSTIFVEPNNIPGDWKTYIENGRAEFFDPTLAHVEQITPSHSTVIPNNVGQGAFPLEHAAEGHIYRGMSYEEYMNALRSGFFQSKGDYNIGEQQKNITYFAHDPQTAASYANGFAPWAFKATPGAPAVVVEIKEPDKSLTHVDPGRPDEVGVSGQIPIYKVTRMWMGEPYAVDGGKFEVTRGGGRPPSIGNGDSPSSSVIWKEINSPGGSEEAHNAFDGKVALVNASIGDGLPHVTLDKQSDYDGAVRIAKAAAEEAKKNGFDPEKIIVTDRPYPFTLNGKNYHAAGTAGHDGIVTLYQGQFGRETLPGLLAHEIMHEKYREFMNDADAERDQVMKIPMPTNGSRDVMFPDGTLRAPYDAQFPVYTTRLKLMDGDNSNPNLKDKLQREDGLTDYSREWWEAVKGGTARWDQAVNETLAEMASNRREGKDTLAPPTLKDNGFLTTTPSKSWQALFDAINDHWEKTAQRRATRKEWGM